MKLLVSAAALMGAAATAHACPWAGGTYKGTAGADVEFTFVIDAACASVKLVETHSFTEQTVAMVPTSKGWDASFDNRMGAKFDTKGKRVRVSQGGVSRSVKMKKLK